MTSEETNALSVSLSPASSVSLTLCGCISPQRCPSHPWPHHPSAGSHRRGHERQSQSDGAHPADSAAEVLPAALTVRRADYRPAGLHGHHGKRKALFYARTYGLCNYSCLVCEAAIAVQRCFSNRIRRCPFSSIITVIHCTGKKLTYRWIKQQIAMVDF